MAPAERLGTPMKGSPDETRVPLLRAREVVWMVCTDIKLMSGETSVLSSVQRIEFDSTFDDSLDHVIWPTRLRRISFGGG